MQVLTRNGLIEGRQIDDALVFEGVPFAAPPVGALQFAPPSDVRSWRGVRDATTPGPIAPQTATPLEALLYGATPAMSQDCLTLAVTTPSCDGPTRPVMVWIHGGAFITGSGSFPWYRAGAFARDGIVVVSINYRLNVFGYCHLGDLTSDERFATSGINGSLDQIAALRWVRDNIAVFGGNPDNVTIFGESAGGCSVVALLAMGAARGLFHQAIAQSASFTQLRSRDRGTEQASRFLAAAGISTPQELLALSEERCLDAAQQLLAVIVSGESFDQFAPTYGLPDLVEDPCLLLQRGQAAAVPLLIGTNRDEMNLFTIFDPDHAGLDHDGVLKRATAIVGDRASSLVNTYHAARPTFAPPALASQIATDYTFRIAALRAAAGHSADHPTWMYEFHWPTPVMGGSFGACHALEIPFVFDNLSNAQMFTGDGPECQPLATRMHASWVGFAQSADPNHGALAPWPRYDRQRRGTYVFNNEDRVVDDPDREIRRWWEEHP